jgi:hypothetical protein
MADQHMRFAESDRGQPAAYAAGYEGGSGAQDVAFGSADQKLSGQEAAGMGPPSGMTAPARAVLRLAEETSTRLCHEHLGPLSLRRGFVPSTPPALRFGERHAAWDEVVEPKRAAPGGKCSGYCSLKYPKSSSASRWHCGYCKNCIQAVSPGTVVCSGT